MDKNIIIEVKELQLCYGEKVIFKNLNVSIASHAITALIGPSGIGKTSFLQVLNQMSREDELTRVQGEVFFNDNGTAINLLKLPQKHLPQLRQKIVYVSQHPDILPFSIFNNVAFGLKLQNSDTQKIPQKVEEALRLVHLWDEVKERLHVNANTLSGGQQQRLILARALAIKPRVLLLDEPTASLNDALSLQIEALLLELKKELSIVMISHFKAQVERVADVVFEINSL